MNRPWDGHHACQRLKYAEVLFVHEVIKTAGNHLFELGRYMTGLACIKKPEIPLLIR
jgi:hypothetical protein